MVSVITSYMAGITLKESLEGVAKPQFVFLMLFNTTGAMFSMVQFVAFFGPLIGIVLGFDTINRERADGTLIKILTQPIFRDAVINGKFLAGVTTITIMLASIVLVISGLGLMLLGVVPGAEEIWRLLLYIVISVFYISFWLGLSILFSIFFRSIATSALASVALWIFLSFFVSLGASVLADMVAPANAPGVESTEAIIKNIRVKEDFPVFLYVTLHECVGHYHRSHEKDDGGPRADGSHGEDIGGALSEPPAPGSERPCGIPLYHCADCFDAGLFCNLLSGLHAPGDQDISTLRRQNGAGSS